MAQRLYPNSNLKRFADLESNDCFYFNGDLLVKLNYNRKAASTQQWPWHGLINAVDMGGHNMWFFHANQFVETA